MGLSSGLRLRAPMAGKHQRTLLRVSVLAAPLFKAEADGLRDSKSFIVYASFQTDLARDRAEVMDHHN
jgi:hypothetical protein